MNIRFAKRALCHAVTAVVASVLTMSAQGGTLTWDGSKAKTKNGNNLAGWSIASNWEEGRTPQNGDDLAFVNATDSWMQNDVSGLKLGSLTIESMLSGKTAVNFTSADWLKFSGANPGIVCKVNATVSFGFKMDLEGQSILVDLMTSGIQLNTKTAQIMNGRLVKQGSGVLVLCEDQNNDKLSNLDFTLRKGYIIIQRPHASSAFDGRELTFDGNSCVFTMGGGNYMGGRTGQELANFSLTETANCTERNHQLSSGVEGFTYTFTGTPKNNPTRFTGNLSNKACLNWNPSSDSELVLAHGASTTSGKLTVSSGKVTVTDGATMDSLSAVEVNGGVLSLGTSDAFGPNVPLFANGGQIELADGVSLKVASLSVNGKLVRGGTYGGENSSATYKPKYANGTYVFTGTGVVGAWEDDLGFAHSTDKDPLTYALNEQMTFTVTLIDRKRGNAPVGGVPLRWQLDGDDGQSRSGTQTSDEPVVVTTSLAQPGFVRLQVYMLDANGNTVTTEYRYFDGSAGADVLNIPERPAPDGLAAFWEQSFQTLIDTPYEVKRLETYQLDWSLNYCVFELTTLAGMPNATGLVIWPKNADPKSLKIYAQFNGYGAPSIVEPAVDPAFIKQGYIYLGVTRYGEDPRNPDPNYYADIWTHELKDYCFRNNDGAVENTDYFKMLMRDLRAMQFAKTFDEWNGKDLIVNGGSMGGWQAIASTAVDPDVTECNATIPWSSDLSGAPQFDRMKGWRPDWTPTLDWIDLKNLAALVRIPISFSCGLGDYICPPSGEILLYRNLRVRPKQVTFSQNMGHGNLHDRRGDEQKFFLREEPTHRTLSFQGARQVAGNWSESANWKDMATGQQAVPQDGDIIRFSELQYSKCDIAGVAIHQLNLAKNYSSHGCADKDANPIVFGAGNAGVVAEDGASANLAVRFEVDDDVIVLDCRGTLTHNYDIHGKGNRPFKIVKKGAGTYNLNNCYDYGWYNGLTEVEVQAGTFTFFSNSGSQPNRFPTGLKIAADGGVVSCGLTCTLTGSSAELTNGSVFSIPSDVTLTLGTAKVNGTAVVPGTYTKANAAWVTGDGSVVVGARAPAKVVWTGAGSDTNWNNPDNWVLDGTTQKTTPVNGDTIRFNLPMSNASSGYPNNNIANLAPYKIEIMGASEWSGSGTFTGSAIIFEEGSWGFESNNQPTWNIPMIVRAKEIKFGSGGETTFQSSIYNDQGNTFKIHQIGGRLALCPVGGWNPKFTGFAGVLVEGGTFSFGREMSNSSGTAGDDFKLLPDGFSVRFKGETGRFNMPESGVNPTVNGLTLSEAYAGGSNKIDVKAQTLTVAGTPADTQTFTGTLEGTGGFCWAPTSSAKEFVFARKASPFSGTLEVRNGTVRLNEGATFASLGSLDLSGASSVFAIDDKPSQAVVAGNLNLVSGAKIRVAEGAVIKVSSITIDGAPFSAEGYYTGSGSEGTSKNWIEGKGIVVLTGSNTVDPTGNPGVETSSSWTEGAAPSYSLYTPGNWTGGTLPDLKSGSLIATFAQGTRAQLYRDSAVRGMIIGSQNGFSFDKAGDTPHYCQLGWNGIQTLGAGKTYRLGWDMRLLGEQNWTIASGDTLEMTGSVRGQGQELTVTGGGNLTLKGATIADVSRVNVNLATTALTLDGATIGGDLVNIATATSWGKFETVAGTENVIGGNLDLFCNQGDHNYDFLAEIADNSTLRVNGSLYCGWEGHSLNFHGNGTVIFDGPVYYTGKKDNYRAARVTVGANTVYFNAPDNDFGRSYLWLKDNGATVYTTVPYAFTTNHNDRLVNRLENQQNQTWDLCGCDQSLVALSLRGDCVVRSDRAATLHLAYTDDSFIPNDVNCDAGIQTNRNAFAGGVGISFSGTKFLRLDAVSSTTGRIEVVSGRVEFGANGQWPNATAAVVRGGGVLKIEPRRAFGGKVTIDVAAGGMLQLEEGVRQRCATLTLNGAPVQAGTYGSSASDAQFKDDTHFVGKGKLLVGKIGSIIVCD